MPTKTEAPKGKLDLGKKVGIGKVKLPIIGWVVVGVAAIYFYSKFHSSSGSGSDASGATAAPLGGTGAAPGVGGGGSGSSAPASTTTTTTGGGSTGVAASPPLGSGGASPPPPDHKRASAQFPGSGLSPVGVAHFSSAGQAPPSNKAHAHTYSPPPPGPIYPTSVSNAPAGVPKRQT